MISRKSIPALLAFVLLAAGQLGVDHEAAAQAPGKTANRAKTAPPRTETIGEPVKSLGTPSAPITMEVFSDFQCPSCKVLFEGTLQQVFAEYVSTGKVYFVHRDMPLPIHRFAQDAARYANAAGTVGKFERVAAAIYRMQESWSLDGTRLEAVVAAVLTPAEMKKVRQRLTNPMIQAAIDRDAAMGRNRGVTSTPTVFVTHRGQTTPLPPGGVNYSLLKQYFDLLLRK